MGNSILLSKNMIDYKSTISFSTGIGSQLLYDRDRSTQWISAGSNDTIIETITVDFGINKIFDKLILLNHNVKSLRLKSGIDVLLDWTDISQPYYIGSFLKVTKSSVVLECLTTQVTNQEKAIGELMLCEEYYVLVNNPSSITAHYREKSTEIELADGSMKICKLPYSERWGEEWDFVGITAGMCDTLESLKKAYYKHPFFVYPFPSERPQDFYLCHWTNPFEKAVTQSWDSTGRLYNVKIKLMEV